jgi:penicillin V acylase-like amidase (Ntn superfamily)
VSKYGSITFNQYGKEFPTGGMNEKGLVVELMWLDETRYPNPDQRPAVGVLQWIQYQLDNSSTTAEVIGSNSQIRISEKTAPIHFLVADAAGNVATIEFLDGKMVVHKDKELPFPVLTNDTYASSVQTAKPLIENKQEKTLNNNSLDRL